MVVDRRWTVIARWIGACALACALTACVSESEGDQRIEEDESRFTGGPFAGPAEESEPDSFEVLASELRAIVEYPVLHQAEAPFELSIDAGRRELVLRKPGKDSPVLTRPIPAGLEIWDDPGPVTFHRDGRVSWPKPDRTLRHPQATAGDVTVFDPASGWIGAYDLVKTDRYLQLELKPTRRED